LCAIGDERGRGTRVLHSATVGEVLKLLRKGRRVLIDDGQTVGSNEPEVLAVGGEFEIRVQFAAGEDAVLVGGEHHAICARGHRRTRGERPFGFLEGVVRQVHSAEVYRVGAGVVDFEPVGGIAIGVEQAILVRGHELGDPQVSGREHGARLEAFERESAIATESNLVSVLRHRQSACLRRPLEKIGRTESAGTQSAARPREQRLSQSGPHMILPAATPFTDS
jgi:hypothetical protein